MKLFGTWPNLLRSPRASQDLITLPNKFISQWISKLCHQTYNKAVEGAFQNRWSRLFFILVNGCFLSTEVFMIVKILTKIGGGRNLGQLEYIVDAFCLKWRHFSIVTLKNNVIISFSCWCFIHRSLTMW